MILSASIGVMEVRAGYITVTDNLIRGDSAAWLMDIFHVEICWRPCLGCVGAGSIAVVFMRICGQMTF